MAKTSTALAANIINHIGLVLDASGSMYNHASSLIKVADAQIAYLAQRSKEMDQETRISVWTSSHSSQIKCVIWDKDVLRLPSIAPYYRTDGQTALIDATIQALDDLDETPEKYGDHSFLVYVLSDGIENDSRKSPAMLLQRLNGLPDHWTIGALVPNLNAKHEAKRFGFPAGNIEIWDTSSGAGITEVGERIRVATDAYMTGRATGLRSTQSLFSTDATAVNATTIRQSGLKPLPAKDYVLVPVPRDCVIREFVEECGYRYQVGKAFYQLMKREEIQATKEVMVVNRRDHKVYGGQDARGLIGLPDMNVRVTPNHNPEYDIYVQSTSVNRKLLAGTKLLYLKQ